MGILALQETRHSTETKPQAGTTYKFFGEEAANCEAHASGGSGFLVHQSLVTRCTYLGRRQHGLDPNTQYTTTWLRCKGATKEQNVHIGSVYLPDASKFAQPGGEKLYRTALDQAMDDFDHYPNAILCGDFNMHTGSRTDRLPNAPLHGGTKVNKQGKIFLQKAAEHNLQFLSAQSEPMQYTYANGKTRSILDHILSAAGSKHNDLECHVIPLDAPEITACDTDHTIVLANILPRARTQESKPARQHKWRRSALDTREGKQTFKDEASRQHSKIQAERTHADQPAHDPTARIDNKAADITKILNNTAATVCGRVELVKDVSRPWMKFDRTGRLQDQIKATRRTLLRYKIAYASKKTPEQTQRHLMDTFEKSWQDTKNLKLAAQSNHKRYLAQQVNTLCSQDQSSHSAARAIDKAAGVHREATQIAELRMPGTEDMYSDNPGKVKCLHTHYAALAAPKAAQSQHEKDRRRWAAETVAQIEQHSEPGPLELNAEITTEELRSALRNTDNRKAAGHDEILPEFIKYSGPDVFGRVLSLYNDILNTGCIPSTWRRGIVTNLSKPGDPTDCGNYRGITLLPALDKLFMKVIANRLLNFVKLHDHQYGFVRGKGTTEAIFNLIATLEQKKLDHKSMYGFFLDVKKAFDTIDQNMLFIKLHRAGVRGALWRVIKASYAQARSCVTLEGFLSDFFEIRQGVAQGCPLSPILFIIFMDDLLQSLHTTCGHLGISVAFDDRPFVSQSFADDTSGLADGQEHQNMQAIINAMHAHSQEWLWSAKVLKSHVLAMQLRNTTPMDKTAFQWGSETLPFETKTKNLGVHITQDLTWSDHIKRVKSQGWHKLKQYKQMLSNPKIHLRAKLQTTRTKLLPSLTYAMEVWTPTTDKEWTQLNELTAIIDRALILAVAGYKGNNWHARRCFKMPVLRALLRIPDARALLETAHARFADKLQQNIASHQQEDDPHRRELPLTQAVMRSLSANHPWAHQVQSTKEKMSHLADTTRGDDYKTGIRLWQAQQLYTSLKPSARTATRRMYTSRCQQRAAPTDPYKHILEQDSPDGMQTTIRALHSCGVQQTGPILAACCGHLLDDLDTEDDTDICEHCSMPFTTNNCASRQTQQWDRLWHRLAGCTDDQQQGRLALYQANLLSAAADSQFYLKNLHDAFEELQSAPSDPETAKNTLLSLVTDPAGFGDPPEELRPKIVKLTATFLDRDDSGARAPEAENEPRTTEAQPQATCGARVKPYQWARFAKQSSQYSNELDARKAQSTSRDQTQKQDRALIACRREAWGSGFEIPPTVPRYTARSGACSS